MFIRIHPQYGNIYNNGLPMALTHHIKIGFKCKKKSTKYMEKFWFV